MKKLLLFSLLSCATHVMMAQVLFSYDFSADTAGRKLDGFRGWSNSTSTNYPGGGDCAGVLCSRMTSVTAAMTYPGYATTTKALSFTAQTDAPGHFLTSDETLPNANINSLTFNDGEKVYAAFLLKLTDAIITTTAGQLVRFAGSGSNFYTTGMRLYAQKSGSKFRFGIERTGTVSYSNYDYDFNTTYLIVMKYDYVAGGTTNDVASLYVNPVITNAEPANSLISASSGTDVALARIMFYGNQPNTPTGIVSGIKVAKTWADLAGAAQPAQGVRYNQTDTITYNLNRNKCNLGVPAGGAQIANITNICPASSGSDVAFTIDNVTKCVNYRGVRPGADTACLKICNENNICDTLTFVVTTTAKGTRANQTDTISVNLNRNKCNLAIPSGGAQITSITNICPAWSGSDVLFTIDNATKCVNYRGVRTGVDTACFKICNENGICDTLNMVITTNGRVGVETLSNGSFVVKPTLAREQVEVILEKSYPSVSQIQVADATGRIVLERSIYIGETSIILNINDLPQGYYLIQVQNQQIRAVQKVVMIR
jgi:hypothetical protein